jgi:hypothetical protein
MASLPPISSALAYLRACPPGTAKRKFNWSGNYADLMLAVFNGTWDWTAVGTLALAAATFISLYFARRALNQAQQQIRLGQEQLKQTQHEIELSRREVEEAHRPVLVPVADSTQDMQLGASYGTVPRKPVYRAGGQVFVPVQNIGSGPALNVEAQIALPDDKQQAGPMPGQSPARRPGIREATWALLTITISGLGEVVEPYPVFVLLVDYDDVAGKHWRTTAVYTQDSERYDTVAFQELKDRRRPMSDLMKPVA